VEITSDSKINQKTNEEIFLDREEDAAYLNVCSTVQAVLR
jgi:hypothetical protein